MARRARSEAHPHLAANRSHAFGRALFQELARAGLREVCISPGSRSTPLVAAAVREPALRCHSHVDERSAAFFALGLAKAARAPVALLCTSGTAAANFHPAVVEAHHAGVPLLLLTADRPPELREWGAGQTIDQLRLYGSCVRWFAEAALPEAGGALLRYARALACRALAECRGAPAGPVHLNLPFREPLEPAPVPGDLPADLPERDPLGALGRAPAPYTEVRRVPPAAGEAELRALVELARAHPRGVIACGPLDAGPGLAAAAAEFARAAGWPLLADPTSQLRRGPHVAGTPVLAASDLWLRDARLAARFAPEIVLRLGAAPTSKAFRLWLERHPPRHLVGIGADAGWSDPSHLLSALWRVDPGPLLAAAAERLGPRPRADGDGWLRGLAAAERAAQAALEDELAVEPALLEPRAVRELAEALPEGALLYVSNSMPVRDLDAFLPASERPLRVLANRGASGIDGMLSSALGAAAAGVGPVALLTGDLAFLHDVGALLAAHRRPLPLAVVVLNNDGGGIFSYLPVAEHAQEVAFEEHFRTPHGLALGPLARAFGAGYAKVTSAEPLRAALKDALASPRASVIEVPIDRDRSVAHHREIAARVAAALAAEGLA
jgi:2-succinyl-5-enolpyruvyl-6-hydroxy-3-cyclohexene-1-carboxylate synthase